MILRRISQVGIGKQASKGTPVADDACVGLSSGNVAGVDISEDDLNQTGASRVTEARDRTGVLPSVQFETLAMPVSIGRLLMAALGSVATSGTGPYVHTFTPGDTVPYNTLRGRLDDQNLEIPDAKLDELTLSFDGAGSVRASCTFQGLDLTFDATAPATAQELANAGTFKGVGGTFSVGGTSAKVKSGSITVGNSLEAVQLATSVLPDDIIEGAVACTVSLTIVPDDLDLFREVVTGSPSGTSVSADVLYGALDIDLAGANGSTASLDFDATKAAFSVAFPDSDPNGGPAELALEAVVVQNSGGDDFTFTLTNDTATY